MIYRDSPTFDYFPEKALEDVKMIDNLDKQILEIIENAPLIVRSITEREIESGVLFPSVSTMDIKRNLPFDTSFDVVEGRLKTLEVEGYIYFEGARWWLTNKGRGILGKTGKKPILPTPPSKPMRKILEETFSKYEPPTRDHTKQKKLQEELNELSNKRRRAEVLLSDLKQGFEMGLIAENAYLKMTKSLKMKLKHFNFQIENYVRNRKSQLLREITDLEEALAKKKAELERLNRIQHK